MPKSEKRVAAPLLELIYYFEMNQTAAKRETTTSDPIADELLAAANAQNARLQFMSATTNMGIRLAVTVVIPIVVGVKLDQHFHSAPSWTLSGLFLAAFAGSAAVWSTIKQVNQQQQSEDKSLAKKTKRGATHA